MRAGPALEAENMVGTLDYQSTTNTAKTISLALPDRKVFEVFGGHCDACLLLDAQPPARAVTES